MQAIAERLQETPQPLTGNITVFKNKGEIDVRAITTFGINVKETKSPIGYFGTGLKYAIAVLLRHNIPITIYSGTKVYDFYSKTEEVRGKPFQFVYMNDEQLGFTTELGKKWELWQAFRELYCNCLDESGETEVVDDLPSRRSGHTYVIVGGYEMADLMHNKNKMFIECEPLIKTPTVDVHGGETNSVFYRGVRIAEFKKPFLYRYNLTRQIDLTEDRTLAYHFQVYDALVDAVLQSDSEQFIEQILTASEHTFESTLDFTDKRVVAGETFKLVTERLRATKKDKTNRSAVRVFEETEKLSAAPDRIMQLNPEQETQLIRAVDFLTSLGHAIDNYPIVIVEHLGETVLGQACEGKIYLSERLFHMGTKQIASCVFEEYVHLKYGYDDESRSMQSYLFDLCMTMGEEITGEQL